MIRSYMRIVSLAVALVFMLALAVSAAGPAFGAVWTDQADYYPGSLVTISGDNSDGAGYLAGELVQADVNGPNGFTASCHGLANESGAWACQFIIWPDERAVGDYTYVATGLTSGVSQAGTFTDANVSTTTTLNAISTPLTTEQLGVSYSGQVSASPAVPDGQTVKLQVRSGGCGTTGFADITTTTTTSGNGSFSSTFSAPSTAGTYGFRASFPSTGNIDGNSNRWQNSTSTCQAVTVNSANTPPAVAASNPTVTVNEGQTAANTGTYSDDNGGDNVAIAPSLGTVTKTGTNSGTWSWSFATTDGPAQSQTVTITANDGNGGVSTTTFALTVNNVAPIIALTGDPSVSEGSLYTLNLGAVTDPGADTVTGYKVNWGDGASDSFPGSPVGLSKTHTYADGPNSYTISVDLTDEDGIFAGAGTKAVTVNNVAPAIALTGDASVSEGSLYTLNLGAVTDPGADTVTGYKVNWGDGASDSFPGSPVGLSKTHTYADGPNSYTISVDLTDEDGTFAGAGTKAVTVNNVAPTISLVSNDGPINEGSSASITVVATDPAGADDPLSYEFDCNNDGTFEKGPQAGNSASCSFADNGSFSVNVRVNDGDGGVVTSSTVVTVDNVVPTVNAGPDATINEGSTFSGSGSFTDPGADTWTATVNYGDGSGVQALTLSGKTFSLSHVYADNGSFTVNVCVTDDDGGNGCDTAAVTVNNVAPTVTNNLATQSVQYSDPIGNVTVTAKDVAADTGLTAATSWSKDGGASTPGLPGGIAGITPPGAGACSTNGVVATCTWTVGGKALVAPGTYTVTVEVTDKDGGAGSTAFTIVVTQEDARTTYTGAMFAATASTTSSSATVTLAATVQDITAVDPTGDPDPGDIRKAMVTFVNRDASSAVLCTASVGLVNPADTKTGTATCNWNATITGDSQSFTVGVIVNNYYTRNDSADNDVVTVSKPLTSNFITGGGYLALTNSSGLKAGDAGKKNNFGFNVKYNKSGTNLQGNMNTIIRRTESDGLHVYQIKGNAMTSLTVNPSLCPKATSAAPCTAVFNGKANIQDITNPSAPVSVDGNATLQVTMTDKGEPGSSDSISITVWNKAGGLWFASKWDGVKTVEQLLGGGNLVVH